MDRCAGYASSQQRKMQLSILYLSTVIQKIPTGLFWEWAVDRFTKTTYRNQTRRDSKRYHYKSFGVIVDLTTCLDSIDDAKSEKNIFRSKKNNEV